MLSASCFVTKCHVTRGATEVIIVVIIDSSIRNRNGQHKWLHEEPTRSPFQCKHSFPFSLMIEYGISELQPRNRRRGRKVMIRLYHNSGASGIKTYLWCLKESVVTILTRFFFLEFLSFLLGGFLNSNNPYDTLYLHSHIVSGILDVILISYAITFSLPWPPKDLKSKI